MLLLATMVSFTACSDDDDEPVNSELLGTWKVTEMSEDGVTYYPMSATTLPTTTLTFRDNGIVSFRGAFSNSDFYYKQKGNTLTLTDNTGDSMNLEIKQLSSSTVTFKMSYEGDMVYFKCVKQ